MEESDKAKTDKIVVTAYNDEWPIFFEREAAQVKAALGANCTAIHHIGSTSVPGLDAKPIIDMLPVVRSIQDVDKAAQAMVSIGYEAKGENGIAFRRYFQKGKDQRTHNVHVFQEGDPEISRHLLFRDWMRLHPADAERYAHLKQELAEKFPHDLLHYCNGKEAFIASIDAQDGYAGRRMVRALTEREWNAVHQLRQESFFASEEQTLTRDAEEDHVHFVYYRNAEIIGYAHLQLCAGDRAVLRQLIIDMGFRNKGSGTHLLQLCERWLYHQGYKSLLVHTLQETFQFFGKQGYKDLKGYEGAQDIQLGKVLLPDPIDRLHSPIATDFSRR